MRQSNTYVLIYTIGLTIVCGLALSLTAMGLKEKQQKNIELEKKYNILSVAMKVDEGVNVEELYDKRVRSYVIDYNGNKVEGVSASSIIIVSEYKKDPTSRQLPVYEILSETNPDKVESYVLPMYGFGLWDNIWGFVALKEDLETIVGVNFDHKAETPGLGARITTQEIQERYIGKKIYNEDKTLVGVQMMKGEGNNYDDQPHKVDGMSGATITGKGLSDMIVDFLASYDSFIKNKRNSTTAFLIQ